MIDDIQDKDHVMYQLSGVILLWYIFVGFHVLGSYKVSLQYLDLDLDLDNSFQQQCNSSVHASTTTFPCRRIHQYVCR